MARGAAAMILAVSVGVGCGGDAASRMTPEERVDRVQDLLVRGVAHAEIGEWSQSIRQFEEALGLASDEPVIAFGLAVGHFRNGAPEVAREWLERIDDGAPAEVRARAEYVSGKIALEAGDVEAEVAAYRRAAEIDPTEPAYPYSLSQVVPRIGGPESQDEVGELLQEAAEQWPDNGRIAAELAQWSLGRSEAEVRRRGVELVVDLGRGQPEVEALVARGLEEYAADPERAPVSLRRALNLLRPGKRFQTDSAALEARLAVLPLARPSSPELRSGSEPAAVELTLEPAALLPQAPFTDLERVLQVELSNDVAAELSAGAREADLTILTDRSIWRLSRSAMAYDKVADVEAARQILVGELDGDGWMEILVLAENGVELWGRSQDAGWSRREIEPGLSSARGLRNAILMDFEHDGDLDLLAIDEEGQLALATHRGEAGFGSPGPAPLPGSLSAAGLLTVDLDNDVDQDLLVAGADSVRILVNLRQGEFRDAGELRLAGGLEALAGADFDGDGRFDVAAVAAGKLIFWHNGGAGGLVVDEEATRSAAERTGGGVVRSVTAGDMDLDGDSDILVAYVTSDGETRLSALTGAGGRVPGSSAEISWGRAEVGGLAVLDLDGDHDPDLLAWSADGLSGAAASGAEGQGWLGLILRGLVGKVPLDGRGARVDVNFGLDRRSYETERPEVVVGLGGRTPSLVTVTWPNGISEFLFEPRPETAHVVEQELRIEGSCPFLYAFDGAEKRFVTDILGLAPLGMLAGPGRYVQPDPEEYLRLPDWVASQGSVELSITEELREVAYLDQVELVVVDAPSEVEVYNGERWIEGSIDGLDLRLLGPLRAPAAVRDNRGRDVTATVEALDDRFLTNHDGDRIYQGAVPPHRLEIELPADLAASGRAALVLVGWLHWGNTSTNLARAQDPQGASIFPYLEIPAAGGSWQRVDLDVGLPAGKTKPVVVDLGDVLDRDDPRVRITTDFEVYWDRIAVGERLPADATAHRVSRVLPRSAELSYGGFSRWYRAAANGPYLFDYSDRRPFPWRENDSGVRPIAWQEHEGFYTGFGTVTDLLTRIDDALVIFGAGEELALSFDTAGLPELPHGWSRTLFLHSEGWEKDGDPNVACGQTVGPLPFRAMTEYPCPRFAAIDSDEQAVAAPQGDRWVDRHRLGRRVAAWGTPPELPAQR